MDLSSVPHTGPILRDITSHEAEVQAVKYAAEVPAELIEDERGWPQHLSVADARKLDAVQLALNKGDVAEAAKYGRVFQLARNWRAWLAIEHNGYRQFGLPGSVWPVDNYCRFLRETKQFCERRQSGSLGILRAAALKAPGARV